MQTQLEYDLIGYPPRARGTVTAVAAAFAEKAMEASAAGARTTEGAAASGDDGDECDCGDDACGDDAGDEADVEGDSEMRAEDPTYDEDAPVSPAATAAHTSRDQLADVGDNLSTTLGSKAKSESKSSRDRSRSRSSPPKVALSDRLLEMAKPRPPPPEPEKDTFQPEKKPKKEPKPSRPSLLLRLRPTNLEESRERFFASGCTEAPRFTYAYAEDVVQKYFDENSDVCFDLLPEAKRILQRVQDEYGGPEAFLKKLYGEEKISAEEMRDEVDAYIKDHHVEDKVQIRIVDSALSAANVVKPGWEGKYIVNIASTPISKTLVPGICDHEVGTHLLRMMNDEHQAWHGRRENYKLSNPWTTEEGFATLNTYQTMPVKLLYTQALRYWSVCRGAQVGFAELFQEISEYVSDPSRCWQMCCRIKRGMTDTSLPGAFYMDQAYFKGAVEILRHLDEVDFGRLYGGQLALQDLDKVHFILRKEVVRLPRFMNTPEKLKAYKAHCRRLIRENQIEAAIERVCKPVFIRTAKEFFRTKEKKDSALRATVAFGDMASPSEAGAVNRNLDLSRLNDLAKPKQLKDALSDNDRGAESDTAVRPRRSLDGARLLELSRPRPKADTDTEDAKFGDGGEKMVRTLDMKHLESLAKPRLLSEDASRRRSKSKSKTSSVLSESEDIPPPPLPYQPDPARLEKLAAPRRASCNASSDGGEKCACVPTKAKRKRGKRSRHRLLAMVQEKREAEESQQAGDEDGLADADGDDDESEPDQEIAADIMLSPEASDGIQSFLIKVESVESVGHVMRQAEDVPSESRAATSPNTATDAGADAGVAAGDAVGDGTMLSPAAEEARASVAMHSTNTMVNGGSATPKATVSDSGGFVAANFAAESHRPRRSSSEVRCAVVFGASTDGVAGGTNVQFSPTSLLLDPRPSRRAVARARSLGMELPAAPLACSSSASRPIDGAGSTGYARRPRVPIGLPKAAVTKGGNSSLAAAAVGEASTEPPLWKVVPIKTLQLGI